jgi:hypothetical protein
MNTELLFEIEATLQPPHVIADAPDGNRAIVYVTGGKFSGPRLRGEVLPGGGDWFLARPDGVGCLDVRIVLKTDDGVLIYMTYCGRATFGSDGAPKDLQTAPTFMTSTRGKYAWLNAVQAVGTGAPIPGGVKYTIHAVK